MSHDSCPAADCAGIRVLEILHGDRAIVSTEGMVRLVDEQDGEIVFDLVTVDEANRLVERFNSPTGSLGQQRLRVVPYAYLAPAEV